MSNRPIVIGVTGGSGSGKSSVSMKLMEIFADLSVMMLQHDFYYKDQSHLPFEERLKTNYDHPLAFDTDLFVADLNRLLEGQAIDTDDDIRLARRILRDIKERGRSVESVINQYVDVVKPMHHQFIEPTKRYADIIVPEGGYNQVAIDLLATKIHSILQGKALEAKQEA